MAHYEETEIGRILVPDNPITAITSDEKRRVYNQALEDMANRIKEYSGEHYIDCDGYFGRQTELIFRTEEFLDDVLNELKK